MCSWGSIPPSYVQRISSFPRFGYQLCWTHTKTFNTFEVRKEDSDTAAHSGHIYRSLLSSSAVISRRLSCGEVIFLNFSGVGQ
jgi:hypothetical protein